MATTLTRPPETVEAVSPVSKRSKAPWWLALAGLLLVALAFGAGFLTSRLAQGDPTGLADNASVSLIKDNIAAFNSGSNSAIAGTYSPDAVFTLLGSTGVIAEYRGPQGIANGFGFTQAVTPTSEFVAQDGLVTVTYSEGGSSGLTTYEINDGQITHQWVTVNQLGPATG